MADLGPARMKDKTLLVTGGGSGIGAAVARRFAEEGGWVAVLDVDGDRAATAAGRLPGAVGFECDVTDERSGTRSDRSTLRFSLAVDGGLLSCARHDSNVRPLPPQGSALSPELRARGG